MSLVQRIRKAKRVYIIGNGGSYANAVHICNDLLSVGIRAFTLDPATLTATANDYSYEDVFSRWLSVVAERGDLVIGLSGSGRSPNILAALAVARKKGIDHQLITWYLRDGVDMEMSEELQLVLGHEWKRGLKKR